MKNFYSIGPPVVVSVGQGRWCSQSTAVVIVVNSNEPRRGILAYREFQLKMNDVVIYRGGGQEVEKFGDYIALPNNPPEIRLIEHLLL